MSLNVYYLAMIVFERCVLNL